MNIEITDIREYSYANNFYGQINLLLTVKSFDLPAIRKRYIASKNNKSGKAGSTERREVAIGGVAKLTIEEGKIKESKVLAKLKEPRGLVSCGNILGIAAENTVYVISEQGIKVIRDPWFSYIHTIDCSPHDNNKLLIASSGFDCIIEYDLGKNEQTFDWFAWDNGFNTTKDPVTEEIINLTRNKQEAEKLLKANKKILLIEHPDKQSLPTALRAAFINSVVYDRKSKDKILATFFHEGAVYQIDLKTKKATVVLKQLKYPHGGMNYGDSYMATSTGNGEVVVGNINKQRRYSFKNIPGKPDYLTELEWLQNSIVIGENILTIDSNRTAFIIFDPFKKLFDIISYDETWAIQDLIVSKISSLQEEKLQSITIKEQ